MWFFYIKGRVARFFLTTILEHVVADGCTTQVHRVLLKGNLTKNKQTNKQNQTLRFIFKKRKEPSWGCFQTLHHLKRKASPSLSPSFSLFLPPLLHSASIITDWESASPYYQAVPPKTCSPKTHLSKNIP